MVDALAALPDDEASVGHSWLGSIIVVTLHEETGCSVSEPVSVW